MPTTIPYDPSLVLANVVNQDALKLISDIAAQQSKVDAAEDALNSSLAMRRSLEMVKMELANHGVSTGDLDNQLDKIGGEIAQLATDYGQTVVNTASPIRDARSQILQVHSSVESPVDYVMTGIKTMPLAADTFNLDVQYFSFDENNQSAESHVNQVSNFVAASASRLGAKIAVQASSAAARQTSRQLQSHSIAGTLVLSVSCTHKNAQILAPFVLNVDKGIKVWNKLFPHDRIVPTDPEQMTRIAQEADSDQETGSDGQVRKPSSFSIISGVTFGSSFVGMVHVLRSEETSVSEQLSSFTRSVQAQMDAGCWLAKLSGGFGVNDTFGDDVKNLLSTQKITSHVTLVSMGVIPSIVANDVQIAVKQFAAFDPKASIDAIAAISAGTVADQETVKSAADAARLGQQMISMKGGDIKSALSALSDIQDGSNKILDITSMMTALDDYLKKAQEGNCGVPVNYYLKEITKSMLAEMWVAKYMPGQYMAINYNDGAATGAPAAASTASPATAPDATPAPDAPAS